MRAKRIVATYLRMKLFNEIGSQHQRRMLTIVFIVVVPHPSRDVESGERWEYCSRGKEYCWVQM